MLMNSAHLHLITAHVPVLASVFGLGLLLLGWLKRSDEFKRTSLPVFLLVAVFVAPTYLSGRPASEMLLKMMPGMSRDAGDQHAEVAVLALVASLVLGTVALAGMVLFRKRTRLPTSFVLLATVLALLTSAMMGWTANLGGKIRHLEIRTEPPAPGTVPH